MSTPLTEQERDSLTECECGHYANEHSSDGCLATDFSEDWRPIADDDKCICTHSPTAINRHAVEAIVADRVAAERDRLLGKLEALHKPFKVCDDCGHDHTDKEVREGKAFDTGYSYTCEAAMLYIACRVCCVSDPDDPEQTEECANYHKHTLNPDDRCPTTALVADERGGTP